MDVQTTCQEMPRTGLASALGGLVPAPQQYDINIVKAENGFIVRVGCKVFVFSEWLTASGALREYFKNPEEAYKKYCK